MKSDPKLRPPPGLTAVTLVWWAAVTDHLAVGLILAIVLEAHRVIRSRWEIDEEQVSDVWTVCLLLFAGSFVRGFFADPQDTGGIPAPYYAIGWLPATLTPLMLVQLYGTHDEVPLRSFFGFLGRFPSQRMKQWMKDPALRSVINVEYPYLAIVALAAGAANTRFGQFDAGWLYYIGVFAIVIWALLTTPSRARIATPALVCSLLAVLGTGYVGHIGLHSFQIYLAGLIGIPTDDESYRQYDSAITAIGTVGQLKLSEAIEWRLRIPTGNPPRYLRRAAYNAYRRGTWFNVRHDASQQAQSSPLLEGSWNFPLGAFPKPRGRVELRGMNHTEPLFLPLPGAPLSIEGLHAAAISINALGVVRANRVKGEIDFVVDYDATLSSDMLPAPEDSNVPEEETSGLRRVLDQLHIAPGTPGPLVRSILTRYFAEEFRYDTYTSESGVVTGDESAVLRFLQVTRSGHCEYFATATTLLFRQAGIPARYVSGYAVEEYDRGREEYVMRGLHAHAWVQAWIEGRWRVVDTTPPSWTMIETVSILQPLKDWLQNIQYDWNRWREGRSSELLTQIATRAALPLLILYLWFRVFRGPRKREAIDDVRPCPEDPGADSEWFTLEPALAKRLGLRPATQPLETWWGEVRERMPVEVASDLDRALQLHYRLRFDPEGLRDADREELRRLVAQCAAVIALTEESSEQAGR